MAGDKVKVQFAVHFFIFLLMCFEPSFAKTKPILQEQIVVRILDLDFQKRLHFRKFAISKSNDGKVRSMFLEKTGPTTKRKPKSKIISKGLAETIEGDIVNLIWQQKYLNKDSSSKRSCKKPIAILAVKSTGDRWRACSNNMAQVSAATLLIKRLNSLGD